MDSVEVEYIYILQMREFVNLQQPVYKIGKSTQEHNNYPKGSILIGQQICSDCDFMEKEIINNFKINFIHRGDNYFEGDIVLMLKMINDLIYNYGYSNCYFNKKIDEVKLKLKLIFNKKEIYIEVAKFIMDSEHLFDDDKKDLNERYDEFWYDKDKFIRYHYFEAMDNSFKNIAINLFNNKNTLKLNIPEGKVDIYFSEIEKFAKKGFSLKNHRRYTYNCLSGELVNYFKSKKLYSKELIDGII
jgi:hypothetical protein